MSFSCFIVVPNPEGPSAIKQHNKARVVSDHLAIQRKWIHAEKSVTNCGFKIVCPYKYPNFCFWTEDNILDIWKTS